ncbi:transposase [Bernardetia sp.]|uniref:transposase n=1 Tax=Bernardetia sp. TaxID=1937974 RepID=UPI0025BB5603|nr:transposase [Bernardetia sp.]
MKSKYVKRTQKDYTMQLKLQIVREIEEGIFTVSQAQRNYGIQSRGTVVKWLEKYGNFDPHYKVKTTIMKTAEQRLLELEQENRLLKKQKAALEQELANSDKKVILFDMMIDLAEKEYQIPIRTAKHS